MPRIALTAFHARQIASFNDAALNAKLTEVWGELRTSSAEKAKLIAKWKERLMPDALAKADKSQGRLVFSQVCAACHTLYGEGGRIGADLTGSQRTNLDYLLENIVDPSAVVPAEYRVAAVTMKDGRVLSGVISAKTAQVVTLQTLTERVTLDRPEIEAITESAQSIMPEGLLEAFTPEQVRDLLAYLMHPAQVPLPND